MNVLIQLTTAGYNTGPFNLYSDTDSFGTPFEVGVSKNDLLAGYLSTLVPDGTTIVRVCSTALYCSNCINITVVPYCDNCTCYTITSTPGVQVSYVDCTGSEEAFIFGEYDSIQICAQNNSVVFVDSEGTAAFSGCCNCIEAGCFCPTTTTTTTLVEL